MTSGLLVLSLFCGAFMCGVIWLVQLIHYPGFIGIAPDRFFRFHKNHTTIMGFIAGPIMVIELLAGLGLITESINFYSLLNLLFILALWLFTFFVSVPLHNKLAKNQDPQIIQKLILTNWPRTFLWTAKTSLAALWLIKAL